MNKVSNFLKENPLFFFATTEEDQPRVRALAFSTEYEGKLFLGLGNHKEVYKQLQANPKFELCCLAKDGTYLRVTGTARFQQEEKVAERVFENFPHLRTFYTQPEGPRIATFFVEKGKAVFANMTGNLEEITW